MLMQVVVESFCQRRITGRVLEEETQKPIKGAAVVVQGKDLSTQTNHLGFFQLTIDSMDFITVSNVGYESLTFSMPEANTIQVELKKAQISIYKGGMNLFYDFIMRRLKYPYDARALGRQGYVYVAFKIDSVGQLKDMDLLTDIGGGCGKEVLRALKEVPSDYIPDSSNSLYILPIRFELDDPSGGGVVIHKKLQIPVGKALHEIVVRAMRVSER
jgi:hypothetical protein